MINTETTPDTKFAVECTCCGVHEKASVGHLTHDGWSGLYEWTMANGDGTFAYGVTIHPDIILCDDCKISMATAVGVQTWDELAEWEDDRIYNSEHKV